MSDFTHEDAEVDLATLTEFPGNPRHHGDAQLRELRRSLTMFGQFRPLVIDEDGTILAGNGMFRAMQELGWEQGKATRITGMSDAEKKKLVLADNRIAGMGYTSFEEVDRLLSEIGDIEVPGYDEDFLRQMLADADEVLELAEGYGTFTEEELAPTVRAEGIYDGSNVPPHLVPVEVEVPSEPAPAPEEVETVMVESKTGGEVQVCSACKRPW